MRVHILYEPTYSGNTESLIFPIYYNKRRLWERDILLKFFKKIQPTLFEADTLFVSSRFFASWWTASGGERVLEFLRDARSRGIKKIVWYDIGDSTGSNKFAVLPYVDQYVKGQVLRDRTQYRRQFYGMRPATDFYHTHFGVQDSIPDEPHLQTPLPDDQWHKLKVGWNWGMMNYGYWGDYLGKLAYRFPCFPRFVPRHFYAPSENRPVVITCRIGSSYPRNTVAFPRQEIKRRLQGKVSMGFLPHRKFFKEMTQAICGITPFGWGEVCYRDFELTLAGAAMIKQDMSHLDTWPDIYVANQTYLPFKWDLSDFDEKVEYAMTHHKEMAELARAAQGIYKRIMTTGEGHQEFCDRFVKIVSA